MLTITLVAALSVASPVPDNIVGQLNGMNVYRCEIPDVGRFAQKYAPQSKSQWCWAASLANAFAYMGYPVDQSTIVRTVYGSDVNLPSFSAKRIAEQLNREWTSTDGKKFRVQLTRAYDYAENVFAISNADMMNELRAGRPIIMGTTHCMVTTAIDYVGANQVVGVGVFDPWPGRGARMLTPGEMLPKHNGGELTFLASFRITPVEE